MIGSSEIAATTKPYDIGGRLRFAREQRGWSVADASQSTKLSTTVVLAIERNDFDRLPAGMYRKAYLRALAAEVGLDPRQIAADFDAIYGPVVTPPVTPQDGGADEQWLAELTPPPRRITLTLAILVIFAAVWFVIRADRVSATLTESTEVPVSAP